MRRAVVLGGGGPVGVAWESGLIAGLAERGVDLGSADFILGTSAGAIVGARLASGLRASGLAEVLLSRPEDAGAGWGLFDAETFGRARALMIEAHGATRPCVDVGRELGALSMAGKVMSEDAFLNFLGGGLYETRGGPWPEHYACTAIDVENGRLQLWNAGANVDLVAAVSSSCSVPGLAPPITLNGRRYMDGGICSSTNADLAMGFDLVVVVSVRPPGAPAWMTQRLDGELVRLQAEGARVVAIRPDEDSSSSFGGDLMSFNRDAMVARAGLVQGRSEAETLQWIWT